MCKRLLNVYTNRTASSKQMVKEFWRKAASPSCHPSRREWIRPTWPHASFGPHESAPKRHLDRFSRFCVDRCKGSPVLFNRARRTTLKDCPFLWGICTPSSNGSLGPYESAFQRTSPSVSPFLPYLRTWPTDRPTNRQADHAALCVAIGGHR